ncbi:hypothetical protein [Niastella sp.]|jgi:hypothetical protein
MSYLFADIPKPGMERVFTDAAGSPVHFEVGVMNIPQPEAI